MFRRLHHTTTKAIFTTLAVIALALLNGCGDVARSPVASGPAATVRDGGGPTAPGERPAYLVFSPKALRAAKEVAGDESGIISASTTGTVTRRKGGKLKVTLPNYDAGGDDAIRVNKATFRVFPYSVDRDYKISMTVYSGTALEDVRVAFTPPDIVFAPPAMLKISLKGKITPGVLTVYHIAADGTVTEIRAYATSGGTKLLLWIPGFSEYTWDDGEEAEDDENIVD